MKKYLPIILTILTTIGGLISYKFSIDENVLVLTLVLVLLIFIISFEHAETKAGKGVNYSIYDKFKCLLSNDLKNPMRNQFKTRFENLLLVGVDDDIVREKLEQISVYYTKIESIKPTVLVIPKELKSISEEKIKGDFKNKIKASDGILFIRSQSFDKYSWIIDLIDDWGMKNSSFAVLRIDYLVEEGLPNAFINKKAQHFQLIPQGIEPSIIPWHLYSRVNERSSEWHSQASFNRMISSFLVSTIIIFSIVYFLLNKNHKIEIQKIENKLNSVISESKNETLKIYDIILNSEVDKLREKYQDLKKLELSIWIQDSIYCRQLAKTHQQRQNYCLKIDSSFIGHSMNNLDEFFLWTENDKNKYLNLSNGDPIENKSIFQIKEHKFKTIVCYSMTAHNNNKVLGICADIAKGDDNEMRQKSFLDDMENLLTSFYFKIHNVKKYNAQHSI